MSNEIIPVLAKDDLLLADSAVAFEVLKGASSVTIQRFPFTSQSSTSHVYNIQVPSTNVVMSREVQWCSDITVTVSGIPANGKFLVNYGASDVFAPFPLNQLTTNTSIQINNTTVSLQNRDVLDPILRNMSRGDLARYNSTTPVYLDNFGDYAQLNSISSLLSNSPFGSYYQASDPNYPPRGAYPVTVTGNTVGDGTARKTVTVTIKVCEPLMVSPFVFGDAAHTAAGIYGVSQINVQTSMDALGVRAFRWILGADGSTGAGAKTVTGVTYANSYLECRFLTPKPSDLLPAINVLPAANFVNYKTTGSSSLAGGATTTLTSNNVQLNAIPDKAIIFVRETTANQQWYDADAYCAIKSVRILFNNQSGLLSSASEVELYRMSVEAGCNQNWLEYSGKANGNKSQQYHNDPEDGTPSVSYGADESGAIVSTTGSMLVLDFAKHIAIAEDYYAPSSLGQFSFQIQVDIENTTNGAIIPELNTLFMTSGVFSTQNGTSACYWGVLNKEEVLRVSTSEPVGRAAMGRMVGGGIFSKLKSFAAKALPFLAPMAKQALSKIEHPAAKAATGVLGSLGYGDMSGSAMTAAGRKKALVKHLM